MPDPSAKRCETCKSWERQDPSDGDSRFGFCGECYYETVRETDPNCMMYIGNLGVLDATFVTREDFGCVAWEAKSNA